MRQYIKVDKSLREDIVEKFNITGRALHKILHYLSNSKRANDARHYALEHGGQLIREEFVPVCTTDESNPDKLVHIFKNGVIVEVSLVDSSAKISRDGKTVRTEEHLTLQGWGNLLYEADRMAARS